MREKVIITCLVLSGLMILDSLNVGQSILMFFLAGVIPGTSVAINAQTMMEIFALLTGFVVARLLNRFFISLFNRVPLRQRI